MDRTILITDIGFLSFKEVRLFEVLIKTFWQTNLLFYSLANGNIEEEKLRRGRIVLPVFPNKLLPTK